MTNGALVNAGGQMMVQLTALGSYLLPPPLDKIYGIRVGGDGLVNDCCLFLWVQAEECLTGKKVDLWFRVEPDTGKIIASVIEEGAPIVETLDAPIFFEVNDGDGTVYMVPADAQIYCTPGTGAGDIVIVDACPECFDCGNHETPRRMTLKLSGIQMAQGPRIGLRPTPGSNDELSGYEVSGVTSLGGNTCLCWIGGCNWQRCQIPDTQPILGGNFPMVLIQAPDADEPEFTYSMIFDVNKSGNDISVRIYAAMWVDFGLNGTFGQNRLDPEWPVLEIFRGTATIGALCDDRDGYVVNNDYEEWEGGLGSEPDVIGKLGTVTVIPFLGDDDCDEHCPFDCCGTMFFTIGGISSSSMSHLPPITSSYFKSEGFGDQSSPRGYWYDDGGPGGPGASIFRRRGQWFAIVDVTDGETGLHYRLRLHGGDNDCPPTAWTVDAVVAVRHGADLVTDPPYTLLTAADFSVLGTSIADCPKPCSGCCDTCCTTYTFSFTNFSAPLNPADTFSASVANPHITTTTSGCDWSSTGERLVRSGDQWRLVIGEATVGGGPTGQPYMVWTATGEDCPPTNPTDWGLVVSDSGSPTMTAIDTDGCP